MSRSQALAGVQKWEAFTTEIPPMLERCDPKTNGGRAYKEAMVPRLPDPVKLLGGGGLRWICRQLGSTATEQLTLYTDTDLVDVMRLMAERRTEQLMERLAHNQMIAAM